MRRLQARIWHACCLLAVWPLVGCGTSYFALTDSWAKPNVPLPPATDEAIYRAGHWDQREAGTEGTLGSNCDRAMMLLQQGDNHGAERWFKYLSKLAEKEKDNEVMEKALFGLAEAQFAQERYPDARDTYAQLLKTFPSSRYRPEAIKRQNTCVEFWLEDTRREMHQWEEVQEKKRTFVMPQWWNFTDTRKPFFDVESYALKGCEEIYTQDPAGPLAASALFRAGGINYYRQRYQDSDLDYSILVEQYPKSPLAPAALELAIQSKIQQVGGPSYDTRKLTEARQLVDRALRSYPELREKEEFLNRTMHSINEQQAEKDFSTAEFYRRTGHEPSAYFYYELVRRRYAGTPWEQKAYQRMVEIRQKVEASGKE